MAPRKPFLLRLDPALHDALQRWASDELRSLNAHIEFLLRRDAHAAARMPTTRAPSTPPPASERDDAPQADGWG